MMTSPTAPIVPIPPFEELSPAFQVRSRQATARLGVTVNSVHACAHAEELGGAARDFLSAAMTLGSLSRELRLLIRLAVAHVHRCRYCTAHQRHQLIELGVLDAKIAAVVAPDSGGLTAQARGYSQAVVTEGGRVIWLAGQVAGEDSAGRSLAADFDGQVREVFARLGHTLEEAGGRLADMVTMSVFITDARLGDCFTQL